MLLYLCTKTISMMINTYFPRTHIIDVCLLCVRFVDNDAHNIAVVISPPEPDYLSEEKKVCCLYVHVVFLLGGHT